MVLNGVVEILVTTYQEGKRREPDEHQEWDAKSDPQSPDDLQSVHEDVRLLRVHNVWRAFSGDHDPLFIPRRIPLASIVALKDSPETQSRADSPPLAVPVESSAQHPGARPSVEDLAS